MSDENKKYVSLLREINSDSSIGPDASAEERKRLIEERKAKIKQMAFNQTVVNLGDKIPNADTRLLITELTKIRTEMANNYALNINRVATRALAYYVPQALKRLMKKYPDAVRMSPGFLYTTSEQFENKTFWITPGLPNYLTPGTEQELLQTRLRNYNNTGRQITFLDSFEKMIFKYNMHMQVITNREIKYASAILSNRIITYLDLLKFRPFWFEALYNVLAKQKNLNDLI